MDEKKGLTRTVEVRVWGVQPAGLHNVHGWHIADGADYQSERAHALYRALGAAYDDEDYALMQHDGGCYALVGLTVDGHRYAIEVES